MTNMTSSSTTNNNNNNKPTSSLTDFSIHSIIHGSPSRSNCVNHQTSLMVDAELPLPSGRAQDESHRQPPVNVRKYRPKNFQCPACKMAFSNNGQLKNHVRIHTGERPFQCDLANCRKTFTRNEELTRHKLIHTGFRPHACGTCSKRFGRKDHLKKHLRTHERKKLRRRVSLAVNKQQQQVVSIASANSSHQEASCYLMDAMVAAGSAGNTGQSNVRSSLSCASVCSPQDISPFHPALMSTHPPASLLSNHLASTTTTTVNSLSVQSATKDPFQQKPTPPFLMSSNTLQQLACDYWSKWYNIFGLYQHQQPTQQPVVASTQSIATTPLANQLSIDSIFSKHI